MEKYVPLKGTVCFSVCNGSFLLKERPVGFKGKNAHLLRINNQSLTDSENSKTDQLPQIALNLINPHKSTSLFLKSPLLVN